MRDPKTVHLKPGQTLKVEAPNGNVIVRAGLSDSEGNPVDAIEVIPLQTTEDNVEVDGYRNTRMIRKEENHGKAV